MNKDEMIENLEEADKYVGEFLFDCGDKMMNRNVIEPEDIDTDDVCEVQNRIHKVLDALKGGKQ